MTRRPTRKPRTRLALERLETRATPAAVLVRPPTAAATPLAYSTAFDGAFGPPGHGVPPAVEFRGALYFTADDGSHGTELWKTDGTTAGVALAADVFPVAGSFPYDLTVVGDRLYFTTLVVLGQPVGGAPIFASTGDLWQS